MARKPELHTSGHVACRSRGGSICQGSAVTLQEIIEDNAEFIQRGRDIDAQLAEERDQPDQFEENELVDNFMEDN